jgi:hypothetical protein
MTAAVSLAFPGSRSLAEWRRQLSPLQPQAMWAAHLLLHRIEALVQFTRLCRLDRFHLLTLDALALQANQELERLEARLHLGRPMVNRLLRGLAADGLITADPEGHWTLTTLGQQVRRRQELERHGSERRVFYFVEASRSAPPHFLHLDPLAAMPWAAGEEWQFDLGLLRACFNRPPDWKQRHGFPADATAIVEIDPETKRPIPSASAETALPTSATNQEDSPWQRVVVDQPEHLAAALVLAPGAGGDSRLLGFPVAVKGWELDMNRPSFILGAGWRETFPELAVDPPLERWRQAWSAWGQGSGLPAEELNACGLERRDPWLLVTAPRTLIDRLRASGSPALKREAWVLAGEGLYRKAGRLDLLPAR